jgi:hypothetical protein
MKRLAVCAAICGLLFLASGAASAQTAPTWASAGLLTNQLANAIVADTGPATQDGARKWYVSCSSSVAAILVVEHRDAANATNLHAQGFFVPANGTVTIGPEAINVVVLTSERLRVRLNTGITGSLWCSVFMDPGV